MDLRASWSACRLGFPEPSLSIAPPQVNLPKGYAYVEFETRADAEKARRSLVSASAVLTSDCLILRPKGGKCASDDAPRLPA